MRHRGLRSGLHDVLEGWRGIQEGGETVFPGGSDSKASICSAGDPGSILGFRKIPWRRKWQPTPVLLPGKNSMDRGTWWAIVHGVARVGHD